MSKPKISQLTRGSVPAHGWYFTSYRLPVELAQKLDRIAQKESKEQGVNISFSTAVIRLLEHAVGQYGPTQGFKSGLTASENARKVYNKPEATPAKKAAVKAAPAKKAGKPTTKKVKLTGKAGKPASVKPVKSVPAIEEEVELVAPTNTTASGGDVEEEVELSL